jgi:hypothetical protein
LLWLLLPCDVGRWSSVGVGLLQLGVWIQQLLLAEEEDVVSFRCHHRGDEPKGEFDTRSALKADAAA